MVSPTYKDPHGKDGQKRILADSELTSFYEGRQFRSFYEFNIPATSSIYLKANIQTDGILREQSVFLDNGAIKISTFLGGTEDVAFTNNLPIIKKNNQTNAPDVISQVQLQTGGTLLTDGVLINLVRLNAGTNTSAESTAGGPIAGARGVSPALYYLKFENLDNNAITGVYNVFWEEAKQE